jgi:hypothetical protein
MSLIAIAYRHMVTAGMPSDAIAAAIEEMEAAGVPKRSAGAERTRRWRERKASQNVTERHGDVCDAPPPKESFPHTPFKEITPSLPFPNGNGTHRDFFEEFKGAFPKREGANPWKPAKASFARAVGRGADPTTIIAAAKVLAGKHPIPTPYVPQAVTWLNQERWKDVETTGPPNVFRFPTSDEVLAEFEAKREQERSQNVSRG